MTGDGPLGYWLAELSGKKWYSCDTEIESGCGISPIEYRDRDLLNSIQWAIGLEWYLGVTNPWQIAMSTDHPNGASFLAYPQIIRLLMDRNYRHERLMELPSRVHKRTRLAEMDREYTLEEIAIITRAGPARMLGLRDKGHLGVGAVADVAVYTPNPDREQMFQLPWMVLKSGVPVLRDAELLTVPRGVTHTVNRESLEIEPGEFDDWFSTNYSIQAKHLGRRVPLDSGSNDGQFSRPIQSE
jgi:formylmethanofuran dehydrogenase subunit A